MKRYIWRGAAVGAAVLLTAATVVLTSGSPASAAKPLARAVLHDAEGQAIGEVAFKGTGTFADRVEVEVSAPAAPNLGAYHGFHVHAVGSCVAPAFTSAGGHWTLDGEAHGDHAGDMPSLLVNDDGGAYAEFETDRFDVSSLFDENGSAVILHVGRDNFANIPVEPYGGPNAATLATGDAGARYACGVVTPA